MRGRVPDILLYAGIVTCLLVLSIEGRAASTNAPPAPEGGAIIEEAQLGPVVPFDPEQIPLALGRGHGLSGTAFSISSDGLWVTARHVVEHCRRPAVVVGGDQAVAADVRLGLNTDLAVLITEGGSEPLPVRGGNRLGPGTLGYTPGFPQGRPGEVALSLLGRTTFPSLHRGQTRQPVTTWAEIGRTQSLRGQLDGLSGAPIMDADGQVMGVTIAASPRRGRVYSTRYRDFRRAVNSLQSPLETARGQRMRPEDYGLAADTLRRDLRIAQVVCLG
jgi:Trypsin-like serine proteases, typically periplasmic, contain C-terminal PDZ domain